MSGKIPPKKEAPNQQSSEITTTQLQRKGLRCFLPWLGVGFMLGLDLAHSKIEL